MYNHSSSSASSASSKSSSVASSSVTGDSRKTLGALFGFGAGFGFISSCHAAIAASEMLPPTKISPVEGFCQPLVVGTACFAHAGGLIAIIIFLYLMVLNLQVEYGVEPYSYHVYPTSYELYRVSDMGVQLFRFCCANYHLWFSFSV